MTVIDTATNTSKWLHVLQARSVTAVGRYYRVLSPSYRITKPEAQKLSAAGIKLFMVYEDTGKYDKLKLTKEQGESDATNAIDQAKKIGQPEGTAIYFAVEGLPSGYKKGDLPRIKNYFKGITAVVAAKFQVGVYGNGLTCETLLDDGTCNYAWLSASTGFEGSKEFARGKRWSLWQRTPVNRNWDGLPVDVNDAKAQFGQFLVPFPPG